MKSGRTEELRQESRVCSLEGGCGRWQWLLGSDRLILPHCTALHCRKYQVVFLHITLCLSTSVFKFSTFHCCARHLAVPSSKSVVQVLTARSVQLMLWSKVWRVCLCVWHSSVLLAHALINPKLPSGSRSRSSCRKGQDCRTRKRRHRFWSHKSWR